MPEQAQQWDQQHLLALAAEVGTALTRYDDLNEMLDRCAVTLVKSLDASFARIWICDEQDEVLILRASAGLYTHKDGKHSRIKIGEHKIGAIALSKQPLLTNDVLNDPSISDKEWARKEGMVSFAGHPLLVDDKLIGVMAVFAQHPLADQAAQALEAVADGIALGVRRKQIETRLLERELLFTQFADNMRDCFWITVPGGTRHLYISPAYEQLYGTPVKEAYERPLSFIEAIVPEDRPRMIDFINRDRERDPSQTFSSDIEFRIRRSDGEIRWLWTRAFPTFDENGNLYQVCGITHDITEKKEADRRVAEFYSVVSHELRTPLTSIRAALGLIEGGITGTVTEETLELVSIARSESDRLIRLINDILDMRKMEAGKLQLSITPLAAQDIVAPTLGAMRGFAQEHDVELVSWVDEEREFLGDYDRVVQVLTNLLSNAIKFSPSKSEVNVSVQAAPNDRIRFSVADQGPGIPSQHAHKLFELFQQLDSSDSRARGGTGLGLAISKAIVERLAGEIGFDSQVGKGSTFWFELPLALSSTSSSPVLKGLLDEYAKSLPQWLLSVEQKLNVAKQGASDVLEECLADVRKIRGSSEPCGFGDVAEKMSIIEKALLDLIRGHGNAQRHWTDIDGALRETLSGPLSARNKK